MNLKNKRILITAGPTCVPIDKVRVISNIATGQTGMLLAQEFLSLGARVTLLLGAAEACYLNKKIKLIRFKFFDELRDIVKRQLRLKRYDVIIHSAAVSDFKPIRIFKGKIDSGKKVSLKLKPLPKIISDIRRLSPKAKLVMFKLESGVSDNALIKRARIAQDKAGADLIVANSLNPYRAYIIDKKGNAFFAKSKVELIKKLLKTLDPTPNTQHL